MNQKRMQARHSCWPLAVLAFLFRTLEVAALDNGLGLTPQMGWNSWNHFGCKISQDTILETATALVNTGLAAKGYNYVNLDDCWLDWDRDADGNIKASATLFPQGMKWLADQIHGMGLKLGVYGCSGTKTCASRMGSWGYEVQDAKLFASWEVDYLKYDNCYVPAEAKDEEPSARFGRMRDALNATGRPIFFSIANWGNDAPARWPGKDFGNSWRTGGDITDDWNSMVSIADGNHWFAQYGGPGGWNDPDMLEIGNGGMTTAEYRAHFSLWALAKAPLIIGCDVRNMTTETLEILSNEEVIAVNQDPLGIPGSITYGAYMKDRYMWYGNLSGDRVVVLLHNRKNETVELSATCLSMEIPTLRFTARDIWQHTDLGEFVGRISEIIPSHDVLMLVVSYNKDDPEKCDPYKIPPWTASPAPPESPNSPPLYPEPTPPQTDFPPPEVTPSPPVDSYPPPEENPPSPPEDSYPPPEETPPSPSDSSVSSAPPSSSSPPEGDASEVSQAPAPGVESKEGASGSGWASWARFEAGPLKTKLVVYLGVLAVVVAIAVTVALIWWAKKARSRAGERGVEGSESKVAYELVETRAPTDGQLPSDGEKASLTSEEV